MPTYPTLSKDPDVENFHEGSSIEEPTYRSPKESGKVKTYPKVSWVPHKWEFEYRYLPDADKVLLWDFERSADVNFGAGTFTWTHPETNVSHTVRFAKPIQYQRESDMVRVWSVRVELEQASP